jgi:hypothetical protein
MLLLLLLQYYYLLISCLLLLMARRDATQCTCISMLYEHGCDRSERLQVVKMVSGHSKKKAHECAVASRGKQKN